MGKFREIIVKSIDIQSGTYLNIADETKGFTALDIYLVPKEGGEHERYVVDNNGLISKQSGGGGIPYSGTTEAKPITGELHFGTAASNARLLKGVAGNVSSSVSLFADARLQLLSYSNMDRTYILMDKDQVALWGNASGGNKIEVKTFSTVISAGVNTIATFSSAGVNILGLPNAEGDATFTRQLVQKADGTFGHQPKAGETVFKKTINSNTGITTFSRNENPAYFFPEIGQGAIELIIPETRFGVAFLVGAKGRAAIAIGSYAVAEGQDSIAFGQGIAKGQEGIALGAGQAGYRGFVAQSIASIASGGSNTIIGGSDNRAYSSRGLILGSQSCSTGADGVYAEGSFTISGYRNQAKVTGSCCIGGIDNVTTSMYEYILGYNATIGVGQSDSNTISTDRLFTIGNGASTANRSDAFSITKGGVVSAPTMSVANVKNANSRVLTTKESVELVNSATGFNSSAELNTAYPNALKGFEVYFDGSEVLYKKISNTTWAIINVNPF